MKKSFLLIAMLLLLGSSMFAQDLDLGIKIGYQTPQLSYEKSKISSDFKEHMTFGLFGRIELGMLYVQPEVLYFKTGNIFELNADNVNEGWSLPEEKVTFTLNETNLQVPVLIGIKPLDLGIATIRVQAGPTANFTLSSQTLFDHTFSLTGDTGNEQSFDDQTDQKLDTKTIAWGVQAGIGADILGKITLDINYNFGLTKMFNALNNANTSLNNYFNFNNIDDTKQNLFMVTVGYKFL